MNAARDRGTTGTTGTATACARAFSIAALAILGVFDQSCSISHDREADASRDASIDAPLRDAQIDSSARDASFDASGYACYPVSSTYTFTDSPPPSPVLVGQGIFCDWIGFTASAGELASAQTIPGVSCGGWGAGLMCIVESNRYGTVEASDYDLFCAVEAVLGPRAWFCHIEI